MDGWDFDWGCTLIGGVYVNVWMYRGSSYKCKLQVFCVYACVLSLRNNHGVPAVCTQACGQSD